MLIEALYDSKTAAFEAGKNVGRLDLDDNVKSRVSELERRCEIYRVALEDIAKWDRTPWTDMVDSAEQQLSDVRHAMNMAIRRALTALDTR